MAESISVVRPAFIIPVHVCLTGHFHSIWVKCHAVGWSPKVTHNWVCLHKYKSSVHCAHSNVTALPETVIL